MQSCKNDERLRNENKRWNWACLCVCSCMFFLHVLDFEYIFKLVGLMRRLSCTLILDFMYFSEIRAFVQN